MPCAAAVVQAKLVDNVGIANRDIAPFYATVSDLTKIIVESHDSSARDSLT